MTSHGYDFLTTKNLFYTLFALLILAAGFAVSGASYAQENEAPLRQEYFIQQTVDEALLIRIDAFEADFESEISAADGDIMLVSALPGSRMAPLFQYVRGGKQNRQLDIEVTAGPHTNRSEFGISLTRLNVWDKRSESVARAYQMLSFGTERSSTQSESNWTVKIDNLINAGRLFQEFGMLEMRLWSNYLAAHLIHTRLHDNSMVYSLTREILADLKGAHLQQIELAALQLHGTALIGLKHSGALNEQATGTSLVQTVLARTAALAEATGYLFEQASALRASGMEYAAGAYYNEALEQLQKAVRIADSIGATELGHTIRENIAKIHSRQGHTAGSNETLQQIEKQLTNGSSGDKLALKLLQQARLLINDYRYQEAGDVLARALSAQNNSAIEKQLNFELARISFENGQSDKALTNLRNAGVSSETRRARSANPVINVGEGLRLLANIYRVRGEFTPMHKARDAAGRYNPELSSYLYDQALDELATGDRGQQRARSLFRQTHMAATAAGHVDLEHLSRLQFCALPGSGEAQGLCARTSIRHSYQQLTDTGVPRFAVEAMMLRARILAVNGQFDEALDALESLVDEIHFLRYSLPGVLGSWYLGKSEQIFGAYLTWLQSASEQRKAKDGAASLLLLSKLRLLDNPPVVATNDNLQLRERVSRRAAAEPGQSANALSTEINQALEKLRITFSSRFDYLSGSGLQRYLRNLADDETVLTYHLGPNIAQVWVGHKGRVLRRSLPNPAEIYGALQIARQNLAYTGVAAFNRKMESLGQYLVAPVADLLTETVYWVSAGPLLGLPLDALRVNGRYLLEDHTLVYQLRLPSPLSPGEGLRAGSPDTVFLAGHPQDYSADYAARLDTSPEISMLADRFVGPGLSIVQGTALLPDEFDTRVFSQAGLVHLTMPGIIDLGEPGRSEFELSGKEDEPGRSALTVTDISVKKMAAKLAFLSGTRVNGSSHSGFNTRLAIVSEFLDAGTRAVIVGLWASDGKAAENLIDDFYRQLETTGDAAAALRDAKRGYLEKNQDNGLYDWAGFQLFTK